MDVIKSGNEIKSKKAQDQKNLKEFNVRRSQRIKVRELDATRRFLSFSCKKKKKKKKKEKCADNINDQVVQALNSLTEKV